MTTISPEEEEQGNRSTGHLLRSTNMVARMQLMKIQSEFRTLD